MCYNNSFASVERSKYLNDKTNNETENKLYIYTDFGTYYDFFDITPQKF